MSVFKLIFRKPEESEIDKIQVFLQWQTHEIQHLLSFSIPSACFHQQKNNPIEMISTID